MDNNRLLEKTFCSYIFPPLEYLLPLQLSVCLFPNRFHAFSLHSFLPQRFFFFFLFSIFPTAPIGIASHISVQPLSTHSLKILWKSPALMSIPQRIDGYYVGFREITDYRTSSSSIPSSTNTFSYKKIETGLAVQKQSSSSPSSNEMSMVLSDLKRNTRYGLVIKAYNRQGTGPASKEVLGQTLEYG